MSRARTASVVIVMAAMVGAAGCGGGSQTDTPAQQGPTSLQIEDLVVGTGATVVAGDTITVNYVGTFLDGRVFDQNNGISFQVGVGKLIKGWDQGIPGMKVGGKRRLTVPSDLAYGAAGAGPIPPNTPLRFEVTLVGIVGK